MSSTDSSVLGVTPDGRLLLLEKSGEDATAIPALRVQEGASQTEASSLESRNLTRDGDVALHVIVSTLSGVQLATSFFENVLSPLFQALGIEGRYITHYTQNTSTITDLTTNTFLPVANEGKHQFIILLSGDGGIVDIINALSSATRSDSYQPPEIAIIPMGTGNALANSWGINGDNAFGLVTLLRGRPVDLPLFRATFSPGARLLVDEGRGQAELPIRDDGGRQVMVGAVVASWGLHAGLVADSDTAEYRKYGVKRFGMAAKEALYPADGSDPHRYRARVSLLYPESRDWKDLDRSEHSYVLTTLVSNLEKGFTISPASKPLEPALRIIHFGPMKGDEVMRIMTLAYQGGKHVDDAAVSYEKVDGVRIQFEGREDAPRWRRICIDGKIILVEDDGFLEVTEEPQSVLKVRYLSLG